MRKLKCVRPARRELKKHRKLLEDFWFSNPDQIAPASVSVSVATPLPFGDPEKARMTEARRLPWFTEDIVLGVAINKVGTVDAVIEQLNQMSSFDAGPIVWCVWNLSSVLPAQERRHMEDAFENRLLSSNLDPATAASAISALTTVSTKDKFGSLVVRYLDQVGLSAEHVEGIMESLQYLGRFPRQDAYHAVERLEKYPFRSEVRKRATEVSARLID